MLNQVKQPKTFGEIIKTKTIFILEMKCRSIVLMKITIFLIFVFNSSFDLLYGLTIMVDELLGKWNTGRSIDCLVFLSKDPELEKFLLEFVLLPPVLSLELIHLYWSLYWRTLEVIYFFESLDLKICNFGGFLC